MGTLMRRRLWITIAAVAVIALIWAGGGRIFSGPAPHDMTPVEVQAAIASLTQNPVPEPDGLALNPPAGVVEPDSACVDVMYLICSDLKQPAAFVTSIGHCGPGAGMLVDGRPAATVQWEYAALMFKGVSEYSDKAVCLESPLAPGAHLITIEARPMGRAVRYSWVWTVGP